MASVFEELSKIDVGEHIEKKNGLSYLSWAWAWAEVKKRYPSTISTVYENPEGLNYFHDGKTAWVKVGVTIEGQEHIEYLPVMDFRNKSIPLDNITSTDVNKAIQRAITKAIARHGLGLYIYAGEDLPEDENSQKKTTRGGETPEEVKKNEEMKASVDPVTLPTEDGVVTKEQWERLRAEIKRTGHTEEDIYSKVKDAQDLTYLNQAQVIYFINRLAKEKSK